MKITPARSSNDAPTQAAPITDPNQVLPHVATTLSHTTQVADAQTALDSAAQQVRQAARVAAKPDIRATLTAQSEHLQAIADHLQTIDASLLGSLLQVATADQQVTVGEVAGVRQLADWILARSKHPAADARQIRLQLLNTRSTQYRELGQPARDAFQALDRHAAQQFSSRVKSADLDKVDPKSDFAGTMLDLYDLFNVDADSPNTRFAPQWRDVAVEAIWNELAPFQSSGGPQSVLLAKQAHKRADVLLRYARDTYRRCADQDGNTAHRGLNIYSSALKDAFAEMLALIDKPATFPPSPARR